MNRHLSIGMQIKQARQRKGWSQSELARECQLNIRTIQRIEHDEVRPRLYTLGLISRTLDIELTGASGTEMETEQILRYRQIFKQRKRLRVVMLMAALFVLFAAMVLLISGIPKKFWAPAIYVLMFLYLIVIAMTWRCPGCNGILGDAFNTRYCNKCGLEFYEENE